MLEPTAPPNEASPPPTQKERLPHSKWGITSLVLALIAQFSFLPASTIGVFMSVEEAGLAIVVLYLVSSIFYILSVLLSPLLGIIGMLQSNTQKVFSVLGLLLSIHSIILVFLIFVVWWGWLFVPIICY